MGSTRTNRPVLKRPRDKTASQDSFATLVATAAAVSPHNNTLAAAPPATASSTSGVQGALLALTRGGD